MASSKGIQCKNCGCRDFVVSNTEPLNDGVIRRRRICRHCGCKLTTWEGPQNVLDQMLGNRKPKPQ